MTDPNGKRESYSFYKWSSISGVKWSGSAEFVTRLFQFVVTIVLARLLQPVEFGMITLALIFVALIQLIIDFGVSSALVQKKVVTEGHLRASFSYLLIFSLIATVLLYLFSTDLARLLGNESVNDLIAALSPSVLLFMLTVIPRVMLMRSLKFKQIALAETISKFFYGVAVLGFAIGLRNVWSFVAGVYAEWLSLLLFFQIFSRWKPRWHLVWNDFKEIFSFSTTVFGTRLLNFFNINIINIIISRIFGSTVLGYYSLAYQIIDLPTQRIAKMIMKVMYPVLSKLQEDMVEYSKLFLNYLFIVLLITAPIYLTLIFAAKPFILSFYGEKWQQTIMILELLAMAGLLRCLWTGISVVSLSIGKPQLEFFLNLFQAIVLAPLFYFGALVGLNIALLVFFLVLSLFSIIGYFKIFQWMSLSIKMVFKKIKGPIFASIMILIIGTVLVLGASYNPIKTNIINLLLVCSILSLVYLLIVHLNDRLILKGLFNLVIKNKSAE